MKDIKRLFSLILTLVIITSLFTFSPAVAAKDFSDEITFVTDLGITGYSTGTAAQIMTRGEFAISLAQAIGMGEEYTGKAVFDDVTEENAAYNAVSYLYESAVVSGYIDMTFMPDREITFEEALKMTVCALGYESYAAAAGGYAIGYKKAAQRMNVMITPEDPSYITRGESATIIYKLLHAHYFTATSVDEKGNVTYSSSEETVMKKVFNLKKSNGIVTASKLLSMYGGNIESENEVMIDFVHYSTTVKKLQDFVGYYVDYYVNDDNCVKSMIKTKNQVTYKIASKDIAPSTTAKNIKYESEGKAKEVNVSNNAFYVYNGVSVSAPLNSDLKPKYGELKLIDNDGDKTIDVVTIWDYKVYLIEKATDNMISFKKNAENIPYHKYVADGKLTNIISGNVFIDPKLVTENAVVNYAKSKDGSLTTLFFAQNEIEGVISEINSKNQTIKIGEDEYNYIPMLDLTEYIGKNILLYLDKNNYVGEYSDLLGDRYGALQRGYYNKNNEEVGLRIFDENGFHEFVMSDDSKLEYGTGVASQRISASELFTRQLIADGEGNVKKQLVKFRTNDDGTKINMIVVAEENSEVDEDRFRMNFEVTEEERTTLTPHRGYITVAKTGKKYVISEDDTRIVTISEDDKKCNFMSFRKFTGDSDLTVPTMQFYNQKKSGWYPLLMIDMEAETEPNVSQAPGMAIITDVKTEWDNEREEAVKVYTALGRVSYEWSEIQLRVPEEELWNVNVGNGLNYPSKMKTFAQLEKNDIIIFSKNSLTGEVNGFGILMTAEDFLAGKCTNNFNNTEYANDVNQGEIIAIDETALKIKNPYISNPITGNDEATVCRPNWNEYGPGRHEYAAKYLRSSDSWVLNDVTRDDLYVGADVLIIQKTRWGFERMLYVLIEK